MDSSSRAEDPLKLTIRTGSVTAAELCEPLKLRLSGGHLVKQLEEEEGKEEEEVVIKLSG